MRCPGGYHCAVIHYIMRSWDCRSENSITPLTRNHSPDRLYSFTSDDHMKNHVMLAALQRPVISYVVMKKIPGKKQKQYSPIEFWLPALTLFLNMINKNGY